MKITDSSLIIFRKHVLKRFPKFRKIGVVAFFVGAVYAFKNIALRFAESLTLNRQKFFIENGKERVPWSDEKNRRKIMPQRSLEDIHLYIFFSQPERHARNRRRKNRFDAEASFTVAYKPADGDFSFEIFAAVDRIRFVDVAGELVHQKRRTGAKLKANLLRHTKLKQRSEKYAVEADRLKDTVKAVHCHEVNFLFPTVKASEISAERKRFIARHCPNFFLYRSGDFFLRQRC